MTGHASDAGKRGRRGPRKITPERLHRIALHYLERYASSTENLRRVLLRRVERAARAHATDRDDGAAMVDALVARLAAAGLLDDAAYALAKAESQSRAGKSARGIAQYLRAKGVGRPDIDAALAALAERDEDAELSAAVRYARRRRLGPWRESERAENRARDLAALGRRGFDFRTASAVIDAPDAEALLKSLDPPG